MFLLPGSLMSIWCAGKIAALQRRSANHGCGSRGEVIYSELLSNTNHEEPHEKYSHRDVQDMKKSENRTVPLSFRPPFEGTPTMMFNDSRFGPGYTAEIYPWAKTDTCVGWKPTSWYVYMLLLIGCCLWTDWWWLMFSSMLLPTCLTCLFTTPLLYYILIFLILWVGYDY